MIAFLLKRLLSGIVLALVVTTVVYFLLGLFGIEPARAMLGNVATPEQIAVKQAQLGTDAPLIEQYFGWIGNALTGNLGTSWSTNQPVAVLVGSSVPITLTLALGAVLLSLLIGLILGMTAGVKRGPLDAALQVLAVVGFALPGFWLAIVLVSTFGVQLRWFPATGWVPFAVSPAGWLSSVTLPIVALTIGIVASLAQQIRGSVIEVLRQDYVRTLRSRGLTGRRILLLHVLRHAAGPTLTVTSLQFVGAFGGAVIVEQVFALRGLGSLTQNASATGDIPLLMGMVLVTTVLIVIVNLIFDLLLGVLNPKARAA